MTPPAPAPEVVEAIDAQSEPEDAHNPILKVFESMAAGLDPRDAEPVLSALREHVASTRLAGDAPPCFSAQDGVDFMNFLSGTWLADVAGLKCAGGRVPYVSKFARHLPAWQRPVAADRALPTQYQAVDFDAFGEAARPDYVDVSPDWYWEVPFGEAEEWDMDQWELKVAMLEEEEQARRQAEQEAAADAQFGGDTAAAQAAAVDAWFADDAAEAAATARAPAVGAYFDDDLAADAAAAAHAAALDALFTVEESANEAVEGLPASPFDDDDALPEAPLDFDAQQAAAAGCAALPDEDVFASAWAADNGAAACSEDGAGVTAINTAEAAGCVPARDVFEDALDAVFADIVCALAE